MSPEASPERLKWEVTKVKLKRGLEKVDTVKIFENTIMGRSVLARKRKTLKSMNFCGTKHMFIREL